MANNITLAQKYLELVDKKYALGSLTAILQTANSNNIQLGFAGANEVRIKKISTNGLTNYNRGTGYGANDTTVAWETMKLTQDRGSQLKVDECDLEETMFTDGGDLLMEFLDQHVLPEVDAYRFHSICQTSGVSLTDTATTTLDAEEVKDFIDSALAKMTTKKVPTTGRVIFLTPEAMNALTNDPRNVHGITSVPNLTATEQPPTRYYKNCLLVEVPQDIFYSKIKVEATGTGGFTKDTVSGKELVVLIVHPSAVVPVTKFSKIKTFMPNEVQGSDAMIIDFRLYHDCFVMENKTDGIQGLTLATV